MKAKRLLSAFLAVAMMLTTLVALGSVTYATGAAEGIEPKVTIEIVPMTEDDIATYEGAFEMSLPEGVTPYFIKATVSNHGAIKSSVLGKTGRKIAGLSTEFHFDKDVAEYLDVTSDVAALWMSTDMYSDTAAGSAGQKGTSDSESKILTVQFASAGAQTSYPIGNTVAETTSDVLIYQCPILVKTEGVSCNFAYAKLDIVTYKNGAIDTTAACSGQEDYSLAAGTLDVNATTFSFGEAADEGGDVELGGTSSTETDGVTITGTTKKYDNAYAVSATITAKGASEIGVLFIPTKVLGEGEELTAANGAKAAYTDAAAIGGGKVTIRAAIKDIPRNLLEGEEFDMTTRAYALVGSDYTYGAAASEKIQFGDTGEVE